MNVRNIKKIAAFLMMVLVLSVAIFAESNAVGSDQQQDPPKNSPPRIVPGNKDRPPSNQNNQPRNDNKPKKP